MSRRNKNAPKGGTQQNNAVAVMDAFSNPLFHLGFGSQSPLEATEYPLTRMTDNYALLNSLYRDNWIVQNVVGLMVDDMMRPWYRIGGSISPEYLAQLGDIERKTQIRAKLGQGLRMGRLYGGAAGLILIRGQEGMLDKPLDLESILPGSFAGLMILDRWSGITPDIGLVSDMSDPDFNLPEYYQIQNASGQTAARVHHSRIVRFTGRELPYLEQIAEMYWGASEVEALYKDVVAHDNVSANMAALTFRANINTMEVQNLEQLFSLGSTEQQRRFWNVMQAQSVMMSNFGFQLVNKGDQMKNTQYSFSGLQEVYESMCLNLCGASHYPMTKLFGRSPAGLNSTGEGDLQNYYDYVDSQREAKLRPALERLLPIMAMSAWGATPEGLEVSFPLLWTPKPKEVAEIAKTKAETITTVFQAGLMQADTAQKELKKLGEETGLFETITDREIAANEGKTYQDVTALRDPLAGLSYGEEDGSPFEEAAQDAAPVLDYPGQPREKNGWFSHGKMGLTGGGKSDKMQSSQKVSATGANRFEKGFSKNNLDRHWKDGSSDHSAEYPGWTKEQYANRALELVQKPVGGNIYGYKNKAGQVVRYDSDANDYVAGIPEKGIATMFKPSSGKRYFDRLKERDGIKDDG